MPLTTPTDDRNNTDMLMAMRMSIMRYAVGTLTSPLAIGRLHFTGWRRSASTSIMSLRQYTAEAMKLKETHITMALSSNGMLSN